MDFYEDGEGNLCCDLPFVRICSDGTEASLDSRFTLEEMEEIVAKMEELRANNVGETVPVVNEKDRGF